MIISRYLDTFVGMYDFATTGGAVGSYDLQIPLPKNSFINEVWVLPIILPTSAANLATVSFDIIDTSVSPPTTTIGGYLGATVVGGMSLNVAIGGLAAFYLLTGTSIGMSIGVEPLLTGRLIVFVRATGFDLPQ